MNEINQVKTTNTASQLTATKTTSIRPPTTTKTSALNPIPAKSAAVQNFEKKFKVYKPNKTGNGAALQFDFNEEKKSVFVEMAKQTGPQLFDWSNKLSFKMAVTDISKLLLVLEAKVKNIELFHDPSKGGYAVSAETRNSTVSFMKMDRGFYFKLSTQAQGGQVASVALPISDDEAIILRILLEKAVEKIYGW